MADGAAPAAGSGEASGPAGVAPGPQSQGQPAPEVAAPAAPKQLRPIPSVREKEGPSEYEREAAARRKSRGTVPGLISSAGEDIPGLRRSADGKFLSREEAEAAAEADEQDDADDQGERDAQAQDTRRRQTKADRAADRAAAEAAEEAGAPGEVAPDPVPRAALPPAQDPKQIKVPFLGKELSLAEVEQQHRSLQGMFGAKDKQIQSLSEESSHNRRAAEAWQAEDTRKAARIAELEQQLGLGSDGSRTAGARPAAPKPGQVPSVDDLNLDQMVADVDTDTFYSLAASAGLPHAGKWLASEILSKVVSVVVPAIRAEYQTKLRPFESDAQHAELVRSTDGLIQQVASLQAPDGSQVFPELADHQAVAEIGKVWVDAGNDPQQMLSLNGLISGIALYRMRKQINAYGLPAAPVASPSTTTPGRAPISPAAATVDDPGRGSVPPSGRDRSLDGLAPVDRDVVRALDSSEQTSRIHSVLGFTPRRGGSGWKAMPGRA